MGLMGFTIGFMLFVLFIAIIVLIWLKFRTTDLPPDMVKIISFFPQYSEGHAYGIQTDVTQGSERSLVEFMPEDIDEEEDRKVNPVRIAVENNKIETFPKGTLSSEATIKILLPPTFEDLPDSLKNSYMGNGLLEYILKKNNDRIKEAVYEAQRDNLTAEKIDFEGMYYWKRKSQEEEDSTKALKKKMSDDRKSSGFALPNQGQGNQ